MDAATPDLAARGGTREVLRLAWPATLSFLLNNTYRINDQFWIQGLGGDAQAAIGATMFVAIMCFAFFYLAAGGALALVARHEGGGRPAERDRVTRHAIGLALLAGLTLTLVGPFLTAPIAGWMGLTGDVAGHAEDYLRGLFAVAPALAVGFVLDQVFIGRGHTLIPMILQAVAVSGNWLLNPLLIYGRGVEETLAAAGAPLAPGVGLAGAAAEALSLDGLGLTGAALATGLSRVLSVGLGLVLLRFAFGTRLLRLARPSAALVLRMLRISAPVSLSIAVYAGTYWALYGLVLGRLDDAVKAGLGLGFQVFEGVAFPTYLGVSMAGASLVGRALGARDGELALAWIRAVRRVAYSAGLLFSLLFAVASGPVIELFTTDADVAGATRSYVLALACSQFFVAVETVHEKVLLGSGYTRPIGPITLLGNLTRIPLAWLLAITAGLGGVGVWWAINLTTYFKAWAFTRAVRSGVWLTEALAEEEREAAASA